MDGDVEERNNIRECSKDLATDTPNVSEVSSILTPYAIAVLKGMMVCIE